MKSNQLVLLITKCPEEYTGSKHIEMPETGGSIGRNLGCTVPLADLNRFISGTHCLISVYGDSFYISDVSTNGTLVNSEKTLKNQPVSLFDGDTITLGQYEISATFEQTEEQSDIAIDIAPERSSNDPLTNLSDIAQEKTTAVGALEDLFLETKQDQVDSSDPVSHLNFSMQNHDDSLIRDKPKESQAAPIRSKRQVVDDSLSIQSGIDLPNMIPANWLADESENQDSPPSVSNYPEASSTFSQQMFEKQTNGNEPTSQPYAPSGSQKGLSSTNQPDQKLEHWEEVTRSFDTNHKAQPTPKELTNQGSNNSVAPLPNEPLGGDNACGKSHAFLQGLGVNSNSIGSVDEMLFKQMGQCLRLCINKLQSELHEVESLKEDSQETAQNTDFAELMFVLNNQELLSPNELVEQMLDELDEHKAHLDLALNDVFKNQVQSQNPQSFALEMEKKSRFITKGKLWSAYNEQYLSSSREFHKDSVKDKIKHSYNEILKDDHA